MNTDSNTDCIICVCIFVYLWLILSRNGEGVVAECLVDFHFLDAVLREECALRHLEALRETERDQHAFDFLELAVLGAEGVSRRSQKKFITLPLVASM